MTNEDDSGVGIASHATAGTAGKIVADTEQNTDVTQAKVDML